MQQVSQSDRLIPTFRKHVQCFSDEDKLRDALVFMDGHDFSQVVVRKSGRVALLTAEGITAWLAQKVAKRSYKIVDALISEVLRVEPTGTFAVRGPNDTVADAMEALTGTTGHAAS